MFKKSSALSIVATALLVSFAGPALAQEVEADVEFTLSAELPASLDSLRETSQAFRTIVKASLEGLSGDDHRAVL